MAQAAKNMPAMQETWVQSLGHEDPLEKGMATHSSIPAWKISWTEEPGGLQSMGPQRVEHNRATNTHFIAFFKRIHHRHLIAGQSGKRCTWVNLVTRQEKMPSWFSVTCFFYILPSPSSLWPI